ncbi:TPA: hypothetical protein L3955_000319 [Pseudomonas aeruginosa]|nr:hypothetical protein [Pseudomonas aeruginosa]
MTITIDLTKAAQVLIFGGLLYLFILAAGPIWGGIITAEATHLSAAGP